MERICNCASHCWRCQGGGAWLPGGGAAFEWYYSAILPDCPLGCDGSFLRHLCFQAKKLARKWEGCRSIGNGIWRSDWRKNTDGSPHQEAKILQCHFTHVNKFLFDCLTTFNTMWLFSRNIVVFVHNILFSTGSIFFLISCELGHFIYCFLYRFFSKYFLMETIFWQRGSPESYRYAWPRSYSHYFVCYAFYRYRRSFLSLAWEISCRFSFLTDD